MQVSSNIQTSISKADWELKLNICGFGFPPSQTVFFQKPGSARGETDHSLLHKHQKKDGTNVMILQSIMTWDLPLKGKVFFQKTCATHFST